ncbi:hypothetical protein BDW22DRAFT_815751 [Trametopsis cervina]|nr:hypothetical protein BDW22DRAFT_815751 [Trametopsis cervina]
MATEPLTLRASQLTRKEHALYTTGLCRLAGIEHQPPTRGHADSYYATLKVLTNMARAWLCGAFPDLYMSNRKRRAVLCCSSACHAPQEWGGFGRNRTSCLHCRGRLPQ